MTGRMGVANRKKMMVLLAGALLLIISLAPSVALAAGPVGHYQCINGKYEWVGGGTPKFNGRLLGQACARGVDHGAILGQTNIGVNQNMFGLNFRSGTVPAFIVTFLRAEGMTDAQIADLFVRFFPNGIPANMNWNAWFAAHMGLFTGGLNLGTSANVSTVSSASTTLASTTASNTTTNNTTSTSANTSSSKSSASASTKAAPSTAPTTGGGLNPVSPLILTLGSLLMVAGLATYKFSLDRG